MSQEAISDALIAPFRPNVSAYNGASSHRLDTGEGQHVTTGDGDASRMFAQKKIKAPHPSEETSAAFKSLSIFTGEDERFAYVSRKRPTLAVETHSCDAETSRLPADRNDSK